MATEQILQQITIPANSDLSALQFYAMDVNSSGNAVIPTGAGARVIGVLQNKPNAAGLPAGIAIDGITKAVAGAAIAAGALVTVAADGRFVTAATTNFIVGRAMTAAGAANVIFELLLVPGSAAVP